MSLLHLERTRVAMAEARLDGLVAASQENVLYTTGILNVNMFVLARMVQCYAVLSKEEPSRPAVVMGVGDADQFLSAFPGVGPLFVYGAFYREVSAPEELDDRERRLKALTVDAPWHPTPGAALEEALRRLGMTSGRVGVDEDGVSAAALAHVAAVLPEVTLIPAAGLFRRIRMVKTAEEVERLRRAQAAAEAGIKAVAAAAAPGLSEREMVQIYTSTVARHGGRPTIALIKIGRNAALGQLPPENRYLVRGDSVWFDVGALVDGYHADLARILSLGEPTGKLQRYYRAALTGEEHACSITRPGMRADELFAETVQTVRRAGIPHYRRHHVGHGIGAEIYDPPVLNAGTTTPIEAGMVLNVETPYYELGWGAVHVEDPYLVGPDGRNDWLTTMSRELLIVG